MNCWVGRADEFQHLEDGTGTYNHGVVVNAHKNVHLLPLHPEK